MKQFSPKASIIVSQLYRQKLRFFLSLFLSKTNFIYQSLHISSEDVCQYLLALFMQLHKYNIHLILICLLHTAQAGKLLPGNCLISQYFFTRKLFMCHSSVLWLFFPLVLASGSMLSIQSHTERTHYRIADEPFAKQRVKLTLLES